MDRKVGKSYLLPPYLSCLEEKVKIINEEIPSVRACSDVKMVDSEAVQVLSDKISASFL
jgi:hypothetical protein